MVNRHQRVDAVGERALVAAIQAAIATSPPHGDDGVQVGVGDDAAVVGAAFPLAVTMDAISAETDWCTATVRPADIGHRAVAVNLSDLAAMGATPRWLLLGLELAPDETAGDVLDALEGALALTARHHATLVGGDVGIRAGPSTWTVTAIGEQRGRTLRRNAAQVGDLVWLVGQLGWASLGLQWLQGAPASIHNDLRARADSAHRRPTPMVAAGIAAADVEGIHAAIDVSDGLGLDAQRLASASGVALALDPSELPGFDPDTRAALDVAHVDWLGAVAAGGDDYALILTADHRCDVPALLASCGAPVTRLGVVRAGSGVSLCVSGLDATDLLGGHLHGRPPPPPPTVV